MCCWDKAGGTNVKHTIFSHFQDQLDTEWWDIEAVFAAVVTIMEKAQARALQPLKDRRQVLEKEADELKTDLEAEISRFKKTISELDRISALEDHILFLQVRQSLLDCSTEILSSGADCWFDLFVSLFFSQSYPSLQDLDDIKDWAEIELDTSLSFGTMRKITTQMLEEIQQELEKLTTIGNCSILCGKINK